MDLFNYSRRESSEVNIGATPLGGNNPIRIQSMTNTVTMDTEACVEQAKRIIDAGGEYVRLTTQGVREAENLKKHAGQGRSHVLRLVHGKGRRRAVQHGHDHSRADVLRAVCPGRI